MDADRKIVKEIGGALTRETRVQRQAGDIHVTSESGYVTLDGTLPTVAAKRLAVRLAAEGPGVRAVRDELRVTVANPMGDLEIAEHVRHALLQERNIEEGHIEIETDPDGLVILRGTVHSLVQRRLCEVLCWWIPGVSNVRNLVVVDPAEEDSDEELRDNLITIMEKDVLVRPDKFRVEVRDGVVTLRGRVDTPLEREVAERDCWYTPGVLDVVNELTTG